MIKLIKGDLFTTKCQIIAHGVNCSGGFGSGIAAQIAKRYPHVRKAYLEKFENPGWELGDIQVNFSDSNLSCPLIVNIATQQEFGYDGKKYASYTAIRLGMNRIIKYANEMKFSIAIPRLGCGLGGLKWERVLKILVSVNQKYPDVNIEVYYL